MSKFEVKNLKEKKEGKPSIFIGSSFESLAIAEAVKNLFQHEEFEVDIWDEDIFDPAIPKSEAEFQVRENLKEKIIQLRKFKSDKSKYTNVESKESEAVLPRNIDSLKNFTDIYDFAIFIFVPDDKLISQTRARKDNPKETLEGLGTRHNVVFEFGMFLGRIGSKKTFIIADADPRLDEFIERFFTDLKGVKIYKYQGHYEEWLQSDDQNVLPYDKQSLTEQVDLIAKEILRTKEEIDISFLPSTSLAIGFFENMMKLVIENLARLKEGVQVEVQNQEKKEEKAIELEFPLERKSIKFKLILPNRLLNASHKQYQKYINHYGMIRVAIPTKTRPITVFCHPDVLKKNGQLIIYDVPSTLFSSWNAIEMITKVDNIKELLNEKERQNFKKAIDHLIKKNLKDQSVKGLDSIEVEVISIQEIALDFPGIEPLAEQMEAEFSK